MRPARRFFVATLALILVGLECTLTANCRAGETNYVFLAHNSLRGSVITPQGLRSLNLGADPSFFLGTNATAAVLGIAISHVDCGELGPQPVVSLVAYDKIDNKILDTIVRFDDIVPIFSGQSELIMDARGRRLGSLVAGKMEALITMNYQPCGGGTSESRPTKISIEPLGLIKPFGMPPFVTPFTPDDATLEIASDSPTNPKIEVSLSGSGGLGTTNCNLSITPNSLSFGNIQLGSNSSLNVSLRNNGGVSCLVTSLVFNGSTDFSQGAPPVPFAVAPGQLLQIPVTYVPLGVGPDSAVLQIGSTDPVGPITNIKVLGTGVVSSATCNLTVSPLSVSFGSVTLGTNKTRNVTLTNSGTTNCNVSSLVLTSVSTEYSSTVSNVTPITLSPLSFSIAAQSNAIVSVTYTPINTTRDTGFIQITSDDPITPNAFVNLTATGVAAVVSLKLDPAQLNFGSVIVGTNRTLTVALINSSLTNCIVNSVSFSTNSSPDFTVSPAVPPPLNIAAGSSNVVMVTYAPFVPGSTNGTLLVEIDTGVVGTNSLPILSTNSVAITASAVQASEACDLVVNPQFLDFGTISVGSTNVLNYTISNISTNTCTVSSVVNHVNGSNFSGSNPNIPFSLPGGSFVNLTLRFNPSNSGPDGGSVDFLSDDSSEPVISVTFTGMATQCEIAFSTNAVDFGMVLVSSNQTQTVTISNTNNVACTIKSISLSGSSDFRLDPIVPTDQFTLGPGGSVLIPIQYQPSGVGNDNGALQVQSDDLNGPSNVTLTGQGVRCDLRVDMLSVLFGNVNIGTTNTLPLRLINLGGTNCTCDSLMIFDNGSFSITNALATPFNVGTGTNNTVELGVQYLPTDVETIIIQGGSIKSAGGIIGIVLPSP